VGSSEASSVEEILRQAERLENEYDWSGATRSYEKILNLLDEDDSSRRGEMHERLGYALYRFAFQAETYDEFRERLGQSVVAYEKAMGCYGRLNRPVKVSRALRSNAMIAYIGYWLASEMPEKKKLLDECWQRTKEALDAFKEAGDALEYGRTYNRLSSTAHLIFAFEWSFQAREKTVKEAIEYGEKAIILLSAAIDSSELAKAYAKTASYLTMLSYVLIPDIEEKEKYNQKGLGYWQKAIELSEETTLLEMLDVSGWTVLTSPDWIMTHSEKALNCAMKVRDKYHIGNALDRLAYATFWKSEGTEDPEKKMEILQRALQYAESSQHQFSAISFVTPRYGAFWTRAPYLEYYYELSTFETDIPKRRRLLEKAVADGDQAVKLAEKTTYPWIVCLTKIHFSQALASLAQMETNPEQKKRLLEKALEHGEEAAKITDQLYPFVYFLRGVTWMILADSKAELSNLEKDSENRRKMLEEAILDKERGLQLYMDVSAYWEKLGAPELFSFIGRFQYSLGELLTHLYGLSGNNQHQRKSTKAFEEAAESFQRLDLVSRMAECYWKVARGYDVLDEHLSAAENFNLASNSYKSAARKIPQLKDFYEEHSLYMQAWQEIEKARHHHARQEYGLAEEHFEKAAKIHKSLKRWSYLEPNYTAWAQFERAEELSRKEKSEEAIKVFEHASKLFNETKKSLQTRHGKIEDTDEKQMVTGIIRASDLRKEYCQGRIAIEGAKILDKKGDHFASSKKYGSAAQAFEKISQNLGSEQERKESVSTIYLSRAWQKMMLADATASPESYLEASALFEQASRESNTERTGFLALGHSRFCKALEAGARFADTRDPMQHAAATQHLESAATYYVKAGFQSVSDYAKATGLLFDAYVHMDNARKENDPEKKAKLYAVAEKVLQTSADSFMKAEHPEKTEQVKRLSEKVREERELALSLSELLHAPSIVSSTAAFTTIAPNRENAVGLERFEHADIQASVAPRQKELNVGENLDLEIEFVNAGKGPALLVKVTEIIPKGFEIVAKPDIYRVENSNIDLKGKRLDPLKAEEVKLVLKAKIQGVFALKPKILYLDEQGKYKSHEPEPINLTVKELGIRGWLKGER
jgi:tetratricopeptide (TPR) repeat protein